jgi:hypothetical protein
MLNSGDIQFDLFRVVSALDILLDLSYQPYQRTVYVARSADAADNDGDSGDDESYVQTVTLPSSERDNLATCRAFFDRLLKASCIKAENAGTMFVQLSEYMDVRFAVGVSSEGNPPIFSGT